MGIDIKDVDEIEIINQPNGDCLIFIKLKRKEESCPHCKESIYSLKEWRTRKIKHALFFDHETTFILKVPRYKCLSCNKTFMGKNNYAPKRSRKSYGTITDVLKSLMLYNQTNESVADTYHLTPTTIQNIFDSYVNPKRKSLTRVISIDEFYNKNLPSQVSPGTKYLPKYDEYGNVKQIKMYDDYGREIGWGDYTNHGYGNINSPDYHTAPHWHERIYDAIFRDGKK